MRVLRFVLSSLVCSIVILCSLAGEATRLPWNAGIKPRSCAFLQPTMDPANKMHTGEDYPLVAQPLYAMADGHVKYFVDTDSFGYNNFIIIEYSNYAVMYLHLAQGSAVTALPELVGMQEREIADGLINFVPEGHPVGSSTLEHIHIEMGATRESFKSSKIDELVRPSWKFQLLGLFGCQYHSAPTIRHIIGYDKAPVGSTVPVWVRADVSDPGSTDKLCPNRFEVCCNGSSMQTCEFNQYKKYDDSWVQGKALGLPLDEHWYLEMKYTIGPWAGPNNAYVIVSDECGLSVSQNWTTVDVNDITGFTAVEETYQSVHLAWSIIEGYTVTEVDIYRSGNPLGPYEKVTSTPIGITHSGAYNFIDHPQYVMPYYYKIWAAGPGSGYKVADPFPLYFHFGDDPPSEPQPISNLTAADIPMDCGDRIALSWNLSPSDPETVERYDIFRGNHGNLLYHASVLQGINAYIDTNAVEDNEFCYKVIAHNGINCSAFSNEACVTAIDNFEFISASVRFDEYGFRAVRFCPKGDFDTLKVHARILGSDHIGTAGVSKGDIGLQIDADPDQILLCDGNAVNALYDTDANGETILKYPYIGGCGQIICSANYLDTLSCSDITIDAKSPDLTHDGAVNLSDIVVFAPSYYTSPPNPHFNSCCDFNSDNKCDLSDFICMGAHYQHMHNYGMGQSSAALGESDIGVVLEIGESDEIGNTQVTLALENARGISVLALALNIDSDGYEFVSWEKDPSFPKEAIVCPVMNNGIKTVMIVCYGNGAITNDITQVGEITFKRIDMRYNMSESPECGGFITLTAGEVMDGKGRITMINSVRKSSKEQVKSTYLGRNHPNPFNPTTTIEYSIDKAQYIELSVYDPVGKRVKKLEQGILEAGVHRVVWDGKNDQGEQVASGVYFYRLKAGSFVKSSKMILLR